MKHWIIADESVPPGELRYPTDGVIPPDSVILRHQDRDTGYLKTVPVTPNRGGMWQVAPSVLLALAPGHGDLEIEWEQAPERWSDEGR